MMLLYGVVSKKRKEKITTQVWRIFSSLFVNVMKAMIHSQIWMIYMATQREQS